VGEGRWERTGGVYADCWRVSALPLPLGDDPSWTFRGFIWKMDLKVEMSSQHLTFVDGENRTEALSSSERTKMSKILAREN
jgi:hypothetical protein